MTRDEHHARAMLLGGWYADRAHIYYLRNGPEKVKRLDADTLEPVSEREAYRRYEKWREAQDAKNII